MEATEAAPEAAEAPPPAAEADPVAAEVSLLILRRANNFGCLMFFDVSHASLTWPASCSSLPRRRREPLINLIECMDNWTMNMYG